jgi:hypothetical protein
VPGSDDEATTPLLRFRTESPRSEFKAIGVATSCPDPAAFNLRHGVDAI